MLSQTALSEIIKNGKNSEVEFKRDDLRPEDIAKELVAFSNFGGGSLLLGVEDDGTISGLVRANLEEWVMNVCRDKIRPAIIPFFSVVRGFDEQHEVAVVHVTRGYGVHALWHNNSLRYLIRVGSQSREASQEELARLFQQRGSIRAELQPVSGATLDNLDRRRLRNYFADIRGQPAPASEDGKAWRTLLVNTEIMAEEGVTVGGMLLFGSLPNRFLPQEGVTVGGMLLFGSLPNRFLPQAGIDAVAYLGCEQDYAAQERAALRGPMIALRNESGNIVENGLVEQALEFVHRNTRMHTEMKGGRRIERPAYPQEALREGIVNALIHRDYLLTGTDIALELYSNRLEIVSPGRLPGGITPERIRVGVRSTRNELLKDVMRDYGYLEHMGMGIPRKIVKGMRDHNGSDPDLLEQNERFIVRLHR